MLLEINPLICRLVITIHSNGDAMKQWLVLISLIFTSTVCCCAFVYPYNVSRSIKDRSVYELNYTNVRIARDYLDGVDGLSEQHTMLIKEGRYKEARALRHKALDVVTPKLLLQKGLVPAECTNGVFILGHDSAEGGSGATYFRCR